MAVLQIIRILASILSAEQMQFCLWESEKKDKKQLQLFESLVLCPT